MSQADPRLPAFQAIVDELVEIDRQEHLLHQRKLALKDRLKDMAGFTVGDVIALNPKEKGAINSVTVDIEPHPVDDGKWVLCARMECSPLTSNGVPSKRETHRRVMRIVPGLSVSHTTSNKE
jgi:hypothetical protein